MWDSANDPVEIEFGAGGLDVRDIWRETKALLATPLDKREIEEALAFLSSPCIAGVVGRGSDHAITAPPELIVARLRSLASAIEAKAMGTDSRRDGSARAIPPSFTLPRDGELKTSSISNDIDPAQVRVWAVTEGRSVNARGRLPESLIRDYKRAHDLSPY
jgi:hypothetical protein